MSRNSNRKRALRKSKERRENLKSKLNSKRSREALQKDIQHTALLKQDLVKHIYTCISAKLKLESMLKTSADEEVITKLNTNIATIDENLKQLEDAYKTLVTITDIFTDVKSLTDMIGKLDSSRNMFTELSKQLSELEGGDTPIEPETEDYQRLSDIMRAKCDELIEIEASAQEKTTDEVESDESSYQCDEEPCEEESKEGLSKTPDGYHVTPMCSAPVA